MSHPDRKPLLSVSGIRKHWPDSDRPALDGIDLAIPEGRILGLLGPNGAGKTTLLSVLMGLTSADSGALELDGKALDRKRRSLRRIAGLVPQDIALYPMLTGRENLDLFSGLLWKKGTNRRQASERCAAIADLGTALGRRVERYSGGQKRRLNLAVGLLGEPRLLLLDEPTVGIDPQSRHFILQSIRRLCDEEGMTVVHTTHYMEEVESICDDVAIMDQGRILLHERLDQALQQARQSSTLRISLALPPGPELLASFEKLSSKLSRYHEEEFLLTLNTGQQGIQALLQAVESHGNSITTLRYGASLEALFLSLTGRALRD